MADYDLVIRGGVVVDVSGGQAYESDIAIHGDRIVQIGKVSRSGAEEVNAKGMLVTPGIIDVHTHFDGQATWSDEPRPVYDLPSGARRLMQDTEAYVATIKSGEITYREGKSTGCKPGRLLRAA